MAQQGSRREEEDARAPEGAPCGCPRAEGVSACEEGRRGPDAKQPGCAERPVRRPCCRRRGGGGGALVEPAALAALLSAEGYGYDMRRTILEMSGGSIDVDSGGLYRSLRRLEGEGAVVSHWADDGAGPRRREYELTDAGADLALQWLSALQERLRLDELLVGLLRAGLEASGARSGAQRDRTQGAGSAEPGSAGRD